jgi:hypothetical protein
MKAGSNRTGRSLLQGTQGWQSGLSTSRRCLTGNQGFHVGSLESQPGQSHCVSFDHLVWAREPGNASRHSPRSSRSPIFYAMGGHASYGTRFLAAPPFRTRNLGRSKHVGLGSGPAGASPQP